MKNRNQRAQERKQWNEIIEQAKTHRVLELKKKKNYENKVQICGIELGKHKSVEICTTLILSI